MSDNAKNWIMFAARFCMGGMFIITGFRKWIGIAGAGGFAGSSKFVAGTMGVNMEIAQVLLAIACATEIIGGIMLILGYRTRFAAIALIIFVAVLTPFFHGPWNFPMPRAMNEFDQALKNFNLICGMLLIIAFGPGRYSMDAKAGRAPLLAGSPAIA